jgi:hypothetical protein
MERSPVEAVVADGLLIESALNAGELELTEGSSFLQLIKDSRVRFIQHLENSQLSA